MLISIASSIISTIATIQTLTILLALLAILINSTDINTTATNNTKLATCLCLVVLVKTVVEPSQIYETSDPD